MGEREIDWRAVSSALGRALGIAPPWGGMADTWTGMGVVVEAMKARGYWWECRLSGGGYAANFTGNTRDTCYADTAPRAVALAALRAVAPDVAAELVDG